MVQYRGVHGKTVSDYRYMGNKDCNINGKVEQISERGYTKIMKLSKSRGEYVINMTRAILKDKKITYKKTL